MSQPTGATVEIDAETHQRLQALGEQVGFSFTDIIGKLPQIITAIIPVIEILFGAGPAAGAKKV
ncbi:MAG: hypothetical protein ACREQ5_00185 [Candidatus Dormibacteria bacterium]